MKKVSERISNKLGQVVAGEIVLCYLPFCSPKSRTFYLPAGSPESRTKISLVQPALLQGHGGTALIATKGKALSCFGLQALEFVTEILSIVRDYLPYPNRFVGTAVYRACFLPKTMHVDNVDNSLDQRHEAFSTSSCFDLYHLEVYCKQ